MWALWCSEAMASVALEASERLDLAIKTQIPKSDNITNLTVFYQRPHSSAIRSPQVDLDYFTETRVIQDFGQSIRSSLTLLRVMIVSRTNIYALDAVAIFAMFAFLRSWMSRRKRRLNGIPLPPGPKGLPIIGNALSMPEKDQWETLREWKEKYGDLIYVEVLGTNFLLLNSYDAAIELLVKRGSIYSSRPSNTMLDMEGWSDWFAVSMPYGDELRKIRQYLNKFFQRSVTPEYHEIQKQSTYSLLSKLVQDPDNFADHLKYFAAEAIIKVTFGYQIVEHDPYINLVDQASEAFAIASQFSLVNAIPALRHLPTWFPFTGFHKLAQKGRQVSMAMYHDPYHRAKSMISDGAAGPSMTSKLMELQTDKKGIIHDEATIAKAVGITYAAGGDTIVSVLLTFLMAMVLYPEAMIKGQEELDNVIGRNDLPTFEDRPKLPYIDAICSECLRWQTVAPIGNPHLAEKDDVYNGYFIPAGTAVFANAWAILRDPKRYADPEKFIPDRWIPSPGKERPLDPATVAFGLGRRICPGRFFAQNSMFIVVASILACFNIQKALDENGAPITPAESFTSTIIRHPLPFKCKITPRSEEAIALIRQAASFAK